MGMGYLCISAFLNLRLLRTSGNASNFSTAIVVAWGVGLLHAPSSTAFWFIAKRLEVSVIVCPILRYGQM